MNSPILPGNLDTLWAILVFGAMVLIGVCAVAFYLVNAWIMSAFYKKVGVAQYKAWIPVYQLWPYFELGGFHGAWSLLGIFGLLPLVMLSASALPLMNLGSGSPAGYRFLENFDWQYLSGPMAVGGALLAFLAQFAPLGLTIIGAIVAYRMAKVFEKDPALCVVAFVLLPPVFFGMLGLTNAQADREKLEGIRRKAE